jgi:adenine-specific DNA-methyltransferase
MDELRKKRFTDTLTGPYDHQTFILFLKELLNDVQIVNPDRLIQPYNTFSVAISGYYHIGNFTGKNGSKIALFSVELKNNKNLENARSMQRNFVKNLLEESGFQGALVAFYTKEEPDKWRLSFVRLDYEFSQGKISKKLTPAKRYSFLVGKGEPCHTAQQQLFPIFGNENENPSIDDLESAFSVEAVTDDFFNQYKEKFLQLKDVLDNNESFNAEAESRGFTSEQFAKKLMGQIVFLYFVQKKGWLGVGAFPPVLTSTEYKNAFYSRGQKPKQLMPVVYSLGADGNYHRNGKAIINLSGEDQVALSKIVRGNPWGSGPKDFMRQLFDIAEQRNKNYFDDFLEPLFYTGLNQNRGENAYFVPLNCRIPFLNGGLFEQLDGYDWEHNDFSIPNEIFSNRETKGDREADGILDIFDRYNFTIAEDEPMEREIAIDPEMLGKVFENLLDVKDRKSKGAFYTPREIVHFMCQETLINFLANKTGIPEEDIRKFILYGEYFYDEDTRKTIYVKSENGAKGHMEYDKNKDLEIPETIFSFKKNVNRLQELDDLLDNVKVADLAVGSGAFPLGMLTEIVKARTTITSYLAIEKNSFDRGLLYANRSPYRLKRAAIKNSIFACDIEPSATDITKLRLWLSLVIDDQIMDYQDEERGYDTKPRELPNLDCNIICGNSLMDEFGGIQLITENSVLKNVSVNRQGSMYDEQLSVQIQKLIDLQSKLYDEKDHVEKDILKEEIQDIYDQIILAQINANPDLVDEYFKTVNQPSKPFILWQLYFPKVFRDNGGFDIVIGNPPYIGESGHKDIFRPIAATQFGKKYYQGKMDFFYFFFHKGIDLLNNFGELSFITTNYYLTATGAKHLRKDFKQRTKIRKLVNFNEVKVFASALGQHNMITVLTKCKTQDVKCHSVICEGSFYANSLRLNDILTGKDSSIEVFYVDQENLYDGDECYIRQRGVKSGAKDSIGSVLDKMASVSRKLGDLVDINQGVVSGCDYVSNRNIADITDKSVMLKDGIFVLDMTNGRDRQTYESFNEDEKQFLKPFFKNSEINRYYCNLENTKYLLYISKAVEEITSYPNIKKHLEKFWPVLMRRREAANGSIKPFQLQWARNEKIFETEKIVVPYRTRENAFAFNNSEWFCRSDAYVITPKNEHVDLFYLLGVLNSKLNYIWLYYKGKRKGEVLELFQVPLSEIPIIELNKEEHEKISSIAKEITDMKKRDKNCKTEDLEDEIDNILFSAYGLSPMEINSVLSKGEEVNEK